MPRVTVVIPNYNHARFLAKRIDSVLSQAYRDIEVLLLDDASTDNSREVIARYANEPRVRVMLNETNSGSVFRQWNKGFKEAVGEYVWIAESDDFADPTFLEVLVDRLDSNPSAGVAYCQSWVVDESDTKQSVMEHKREHIDADRWKSDFTNNGREECARYFILGCMINNASSALVRRSVVERIGYADENWRIAGDWVFWARMLLESDIEFVAQPLNCWRQHQGTVRSNTKRYAVIEERYKASLFIAEKTEIPPDVLKKARTARFKDWTYYNEEGFLGIARNEAIYDLARRFDPATSKRLALYLPIMPMMVVARRVRHLGEMILPRAKHEG